MSVMELATAPGRRITVTRVLGLVLVPLVIAGLFLWGLWDPVSRLDQVRAAVVNLDEPVEIDGQLTPLGRVLAAELIGSETDNFEWVLTDEAGAADGIDRGEYASIVTIPETFSSAATSLADGPEKAVQAEIEITPSDQGRLLDQVLVSAVTDTATRVLNEQLGTAFVGNVFVGMAALGDGLTEAADGADALADGVTQLADGMDDFADGTHALVDGSGQLSSGASQLANGVQLSASGAREYAAGVNDFASGVNQLGAGARQLADGSTELAAGIEQYTGMVNGVLEPISSTITEQVPQLEELRAEILDGTIPVPESARQQILEGIDLLLSAPGFLNEAIDGGNQLASGASATAQGAAGLAAGIDGLASGAGELAAGADGLAGGLGELAAGADGLASGVAQFSAGMPEVASGADQLADGVRQSADGSSELAEGLEIAASEVPRYTDTERERLAEVAVTPVVTSGTAASLFADTGAPLFTGIALWAGAFASFLLLAPFAARTREAAQSEARITFRSVLPAVGIGAVQGLLVGVVFALVLGFGSGALAGFIAIAVAGGVAFSLLNQGLIALMRGYGRFISLTLLVAAFAAGIVSTAPGILKTVGDASPIGVVVSGLQAVTNGGGAIGTVLVLGLWGALGFVLVGAAIHRHRKQLPN